MYKLRGYSTAAYGREVTLRFSSSRKMEDWLQSFLCAPDRKVVVSKRGKGHWQKVTTLITDHVGKRQVVKCGRDTLG